MRHSGIVLLMLIAVAGISLAQTVEFSTAYNYPLVPGTPEDSVLNGTKSIRGCYFDDDVDGDGMAEIIVTNYFDQGHVHVFEVVGNDSIQLVWTSPTVASGGGGSTPRYALFGDLDNDGLKEVIYQSNNNGFFIFEWDGVTGSDNYGTSFSQTLGTPFLTGTGGNSEYFEVTDVDGDGVNELLSVYNGSTANDNYYIISAIGNWSTNNPGFSSFSTPEYLANRNDLTAWGGSLGSPYAMITANFDGTGNKEILAHNWANKNIWPMTVPSADTYVLSDTSNGKQAIQLGNGIDYVALFSGLAYDIDDDGREEVYLPTYVGSSAPTQAGWIEMISYDAGQNLSEIDASNVTVLDVSGLAFDGQTADRSVFGWGYGDYDNNGMRNLYFSTTYPFNLFTLEFQGGDKKNPANWISSVVYPGDSTIISSMRITDSLGTVDTAVTVQSAFASKIFARNTDFDKDGFEDMILPYQAINDSVAVTTFTWNSSSSQYDTTISAYANPKRWGVRIVESSSVTGVEAKDVTIIMPDDYRLEQNYPNPFNPSTTISFFLPVKDQISVKIYDMLGKEIRTLIDNQEYPAGSSRITWDGRNNAGQPAASGTYFYSLIYGNFRMTQKMMLLK
jgi:hypothetical protein